MSGSTLPLLACPPAALASKFPQHVEDLDRSPLGGPEQFKLRFSLGLPAEEFGGAYDDEAHRRR